MTDAVPPLTIKRYADRRFFNPATASYVSEAQLRGLFETGAALVVRDARTGADVTGAVAAALAPVSPSERWRATLDALDGVARDGAVDAPEDGADAAEEMRRLIALALAGAGAAPGAWRHTSLPVAWHRRGRVRVTVEAPSPVQEPDAAGTPAPEAPSDAAPAARGPRPAPASRD
jgi:hypothetical protein